VSWTIPERHSEFDNGLAVGFFGHPQKMSLRILLDGKVDKLPDLFGLDDLAAAAHARLPGEIKESVARLQRLAGEWAGLTKQLATAKTAAEAKIAALTARRREIESTVPTGASKLLVETDEALDKARAGPATLQKQLDALAPIIHRLKGEVEPALQQAVGQAAQARWRELLTQQVEVARQLAALPGLAELLDSLAAIKVAVLQAADATNSTAMKVKVAAELTAAA
jgi:hypothetical protein